MKTLGDFLQDVSARYAPRSALQHKVGEHTEIWTYADLLERSNRVSAWLLERGIRKGDRVVLWAPNGPWWVASFFGALRLGAIVVPLDVQSSPDYVERVLAQTEPGLALLSGTIKTPWPHSTPVHPLEELASLPPSSADVSDRTLEANDIAEIMFTSGATGAPKGVVLTHGNILFDVEATDRYVPGTTEFRIISLLPLSHMFEQNVGLLLAMKRHASIYYIGSRLPATIFAALKEHGATTMLLVPQVLHLFMSSIEREVEKQGKQKEWERARRIARFLPIRLRRLLFRQVHERLGGMVQFLVSGGAPIDAELIRKWELMGIPIIQGYGATEAGPVIAATPLRERNPHTVGKPVPGVEVKIAADGEVLVKGPNITPGYWRNPSLTAEVFEDGWYRTGDLGYLDRRGNLYLHGRKKDMIALPSGQKVYPLDIEQVLIGLPGVRDAAVVGLPSSEGQQVHAVLLPDPGAQLDLDAVVRRANSALAPHQRIKSATLWPETDLPRTFTLKVKKHEVLSKLLEMRRQERGVSVLSASE
jgi:long-chain acyl-CoA synthetase